MRLLVDTNVLLDGYLKRPPFYEDWEQILMYHMVGILELWVSAKSFTDIACLGGRAVGPQAIQEKIQTSLDDLEVCSIDGKDVRAAAEAGWKDFEDCIVYQAALKTKADYIITRNKQDFAASTIPAISPHELVLKMRETIEFVEG